MDLANILIAFGMFCMILLIKGLNSSKNKKISNDKTITASENSKTNIYENSHININFPYEEGKKYENEGNYEKAVVFYTEILKKDFNNIDAWVRKGICLYNLRKFKLSIECFEKALKLDRKNYLSWFFKGNALMELKKYEDALKCYNYALNLAPPSEKAKILNNKKLLEEKLCKNNPNFETIKHFIKKGRVMLLKNDYNNALIEFKKVLMRDKYNIEALFGVGYCLNALNKFDEIP